MALLVNKESGLAEDIAPELADQALTSGTHEIPLNDPQGNPVTAPHTDAAQLLAQGYTQPHPEQLQAMLDHAKYSAPLEQVKTGVEGLAQGVAGPLATGAETALFDNAEEQNARREANPTIHGVGEAAGLIGSTVAGVGEGALLSKLGSAITKGVEGTSAISKIAAHAVGIGAENALIGAGDEASKFITQDPTQSAETAAATVGLSGLFGAGAGAAFGAISPLWMAKNASRVESAIEGFNNRISGEVGDSTADHAIKTIEQAGEGSALSRPKPNAGEIITVAQNNNWPLLEGMTSGSKEVQMAEDALLNGPPTLASIGRRKLYNEAYDAASKSVDAAIDAPAPISETQVGNTVKQSLSQKLEAENEPIKELYKTVDNFSQRIPVGDKSTGALSRTIRKIISDENLIKGTPEYNFVETMADGIGQVDNLDALKNFRTALSRQTGKETKFVAGLISEKLNNLETNAIKRFAETMKTSVAKEKILSGLDQISEAKGKYAAFKGKLEELGKSLGKKKVYGPQDFINFIDEINPQQLARRIFNENNTEFASFFAKSFPEEMQAISQYQRSLIKEAATKDGVFVPGKAIKETLGLEPEMQKIAFSPEQLKTMNEAKTYLESFPKDFNPSHTAHESAFRSFFESPTGAAIGNVRDYAIQGFIKAFGHAAPGAEGKASTLFPVIGNSVKDKPPNASAFKHSVDMAMAALKGRELVSRAAENIFKAGVETLPSRFVPTDIKRERLKDKLEAIRKDPSELLKTGGHTGYYMPDHSTALGAVATRAVEYLNGLKPNTDKMGPLDGNRIPSAVEEDRYNRALDIAEQPLVTMNSIKEGTLTPQDVVTFKTIYPGLYNSVSQKLTDAMITHVSKDDGVPYQTSLSLSLFLGRPLDASMNQQNIAMAQPAPNAATSPTSPTQTPKAAPHSMAKLGKFGSMMQTGLQARQADRAKV